jgi:CRP-like cAMP-binding protein
MSVPDEERTMAEGDPRRSHNRLLDMLPNGERTTLMSKMRGRAITPHDVLQAPGESMREVHFPLSGVVSLMTPMESGEAIQVATIGREGMVGVHAFLGGGPLGNGQAISQVPGEMLSLDVDAFRAIVDDDGKLRSVMLAYTQALFAQISQAVACNGVHEIQQRTAKWLLETHDRAEAG